ncbi:FtsK/SpoIIIE domain-containing protein [Microbacterium fluvii]|uniref:FtsK/SpoIIIE domain-containing protein n=1 Tax=Microbacterium fluvii TaxID=415215 RepID=A0ABW2HDT8_9MICO|nr:FtsK/SpoIIIE domain-containing protein [Microbacterium fluvii]MCU4671554.1 FtsK/SpoIIIE domain-containing protein [Microbacterium fluvii]
MRTADDEPLRLPDPWTPPPRTGFPLLAALAPVAGAVVLWLATGSALMLLLAALGPLIALATVADGARAVRRQGRRHRIDAATARAEVADALDARHSAERRACERRHPDVRAFAGHPGDIWRAVPGRAAHWRVGVGAVPSAVQIGGGGADAETEALRLRARTLERAPVTVPFDDGVAVRGGAVLVAGVVRALALERCLAVPPAELRIEAAPSADGGWMRLLPHAAAAGRDEGASGRATLAVALPGDSVPTAAGALLVGIPGDAPPPPRCRAVLTVVSPDRALLDHEGEVREVAVEALSAGQAAAVAADLAARAVALAQAAPVETLMLRDLPRAHTAHGVLGAVLGRDRGEPVAVDLVADGPHAVVAGVTGSGKSELLVSWVLAMAAAHDSSEVSFLLADFKGGAAFAALADLPHVTGVLTDLDEAGALRAVESLRAELRRREAELARCGARDIDDERVGLPRLVVVVDEFAALVAAHASLTALFCDIAARGRALGLHLVLGTQRITGVVGDALLANSPLRISLRVTDSADSRAVIGTDAAARLDGGATGRGVALLRRAADGAPQQLRVALSTTDDVAAVRAAHRGPRPHRPWLPALPEQLTLADLRAHPEAATGHGDLMLGLVDEPERQRQHPLVIGQESRGVLIVGCGGAGKSTALRTLAEQAERTVWVPADGEGVWDAVAALDERAPAPGTLLLVDDLDAVGAGLPPDYAHELIERLERVVRGAGAAGLLVVAAAQRLTGRAARIAELLPHRFVLATGSRVDHVAAGGDAARFAEARPPGRGLWGTAEVQVAVATEVAAPREVPEPPEWMPRHAVAAVVMRRGASAQAVLEGWVAAGVALATPDEFAVGLPSTPDVLVVVGDPEQWHRQWRVLGDLRAEHELVVDAACAADYRALTGERMLPPYCAPGRGRAWLHRAGGAAERVRLAGGA